ncbi:MAG TPA: hypothetical protein VNL71_00525 [Chloroflexota bacterium]|nr:hypothetical protein [Chloroflexota bacterium]
MPQSQQNLFAALSRAYSPERLGAYRRSGDDDAGVLSRYLWNTLLGEALYPALQSLEVALRNSVHTAIAHAYGRADWYAGTPAILQPRQQDMVADAKKTLTAARKPITPGRVVAELPFGFWTSLFNVYYETKGTSDPRLWPRLLSWAFPHMPRRIRTRRTVSRTLNDVRHLRNRVFHHEPLWNNVRLRQQHGEVLDIIRWISPDLHEAVGLIDRFPIVYAGGIGQCRTLLARIITAYPYQNGNAGQQHGTP